jgi:hypothetical protein
MADPLNSFLQSCEVVFGDFRLTGQVNDAAFKQLLLELHSLGEQYASQDTIPKALAGTLFDLSTSLYSQAGAIETKAQAKLFAQFDAFTDAARALFETS